MDPTERPSDPALWERLGAMYLDTGPVDWDLVALHLADAHAHVATPDGRPRRARG